jgi:hypothetical protein
MDSPVPLKQLRKRIEICRQFLRAIPSPSRDAVTAPVIALSSLISGPIGRHSSNYWIDVKRKN